MAWALKDLEKLKSKGLTIKGADFKTAPKKSKVKIPNPEAKGLVFMKNYLRMMNIDFVTELKFLKDRRFRFDIAVPKLMLAIEYEGLMSKKSGHTTVTGYTKDTEKYNLAGINGWTMLRYTALNYKDFPRDYELIKEQR